MKKMVLAGTTLLLAMAAGSASAAGKEAAPSAGEFGLSVLVGTATTPEDFVLGGRYLLAKDMAILAGVGMQFVDNGAPTNNKSSNLGFSGGFRKYLKTDELAPFVGARIQYTATKPAGVDTSTFALYAEGGAEYFMSKNFSFEGSVYIGYASQDTTPPGGTSTKATIFGTSRGNLGVNFYF